MTEPPQPPSTQGARRLRWFWAPVAAIAVLRASSGFDFSDGAHHVTLAQRLADGDLPFRDEMNVQVLGAIPAAPFVWAWEQVFGTTALVLASRLWFVALAALAGWAVHRILRDHVSARLAAVTVLLALLPQPYNLVTTSYNTAPGLLLLVACAAGVSTIMEPRRGRSVLCGAAAAGCAFLNPLVAVSAVLTALLVLALCRRWATVGWLTLGGAVTSLVGVALLAWFGFGSLLDTITFTRAYQELRITPEQRLASALTYYGDQLSHPLVLAAVGCGLLALVPWPGRWPRRILAVVPLALLALVAVRTHAPEDGLPRSGMTSGVLAAVLVVAALGPALAVTVARRDRFAAVLLLVGVLPLLVQAPLVAATTSSSPIWGAPAVAIAPAVLALATALGRALGPFGPVWVALVAVLVATTHTALPYRDVPLWDAQLRTSGPLAGLLTGDPIGRWAGSIEQAVQDCQRPGESLLAYGVPSAYLFSDGAVDSNIIWLAPFGEANATAVSWIERTGRLPDCVLVHPAYATRAPSGEWTTREGFDPLLAWVEPRYSLVSGSQSTYLVLRRNAL